MPLVDSPISATGIRFFQEVEHGLDVSFDRTVVFYRNVSLKSNDAISKLATKRRIVPINCCSINVIIMTGKHSVNGGSLFAARTRSVGGRMFEGSTGRLLVEHHLKQNRVVRKRSDFSNLLFIDFAATHRGTLGNDTRSVAVEQTHQSFSRPRLKKDNVRKIKTSTSKQF